MLLLLGSDSPSAKFPDQSQFTKVLFPQLFSPSLCFWDLSLRSIAVSLLHLIHVYPYIGECVCTAEQPLVVLFTNPYSISSSGLFSFDSSSVCPSLPPLLFRPLSLVTPFLSLPKPTVSLRRAFPSFTSGPLEISNRLPGPCSLQDSFHLTHFAPVHGSTASRPPSAVPRRTFRAPSVPHLISSVRDLKISLNTDFR